MVAGIDGIRKNHHDDAVQGKHLVVGVAGEQVAGRGDQLQTHQGGGRPAEEEKPGNADEIEPGDTLVIERQQPAFQAVTGVQIVHGASVSSGVRD